MLVVMTHGASAAEVQRVVEMIEELNRERNALRERGVFHDYAHARTTPRIDSLRGEIARLEADAARFRRNGAMMRWYQAFGGVNLTATTEQEYMKFDINLPVERVDLFLRVEADRMANTVFREFEQERMILVEQRLGDLNRPSTPRRTMQASTASVEHEFDVLDRSFHCLRAGVGQDRSRSRPGAMRERLPRAPVTSR